MLDGLKRYRVYDTLDNDKVVGEMTNAEICALFNIKPQTVRHNASYGNLIKHRYFIIERGTDYRRVKWAR